MQALVSILIPAFNAERSIADTIRSALSQTWPNKEIISSTMDQPIRLSPSPASLHRRTSMSSLNRTKARPLPGTRLSL